MRVVGVQGVCRVLALFWELIPTPTSRSLLSLLLKELAHDVAAHHPLELAPPPPPPPELPAPLLTPHPDGISSCAPPPPHPPTRRHAPPPAASTRVTRRRPPLTRFPAAAQAASNSVRVAVFQGLKFLLANASSAGVAAVLKSTWASLAPLINDGSERVRSAMLDFLLEATKSRALHWQVPPTARDTCSKYSGRSAPQHVDARPPYVSLCILTNPDVS